MQGISLGNFNVKSGRVSTGLASGLNTQEVVEGLIEAKNLPIQQMKDAVEVNNKMIQEFENLRNVLYKMKSVTDKLRHNPNLIITSNNCFQAVTCVVDSGTNIPAESYVKITVTPGAPIQKNIMTISQLATRHRLISCSFNAQDTSVTEAAGGTTSGLFSAGTFTVNGISVSINEGDTLRDIEFTINAATSQSNVRAFVIQVALDSYYLVLESLTEGAVGEFALVDTDNETAQVNFTIDVNGVDANFTWDNMNITRSSNMVDDLIDNIILHLRQVTPVGPPATIITVDIRTNSDFAKQAIEDLVVSYNNFIVFTSKQQERHNSGPNIGQFKDTAILKNDPMFVTIVNGLQTEISRSVTGLTSNITSIFDIGASYNEYITADDASLKNTIMTLDEAFLDKIITTNFDGVRQIFEFVFTTNSSSILPYTRTNNLAVNNITVSVNNTNPVGSQVAVTYTASNGTIVTINPCIDWSYTDNTQTTITGGIIRGTNGTAIDGLKLSYTGSGVATAQLTFTQGIGDRLYNLIDDITKKGGYIDNAIKMLVDNSRRSKVSIANKSDQLERHKKDLVKKYSEMERAVKQLNAVIEMMDAYQRAMIMEK